MGWLVIVELILEFIRLVLKDRTTPRLIGVVRLRQVYRSKRFRDWLRDVKGIDPDQLED